MKRNLFGLLVILMLTVLVVAGVAVLRQQYQKTRIARQQHIEAEQRRRAFEVEQQRNEEADREQKRIAAEKEAERRALELQEREKQLAIQRREAAEREAERVLSQLPVRLSSNNIVSCSFGKGEIIHLNADGFLIKTDDKILPRIEWNTVAEEDVSTLLRTPKTFQAATLFNLNSNDATNGVSEGDGSELEQQMRRIWHAGRSLKERFITRILILALCRQYNETRNRYVVAVSKSRNYSVAAGEARQRVRTTRTQAAQVAAVANEVAEPIPPAYSTSDLLRQAAVNQIVNNNGGRLNLGQLMSMDGESRAYAQTFAQNYEIKRSVSIANDRVADAQNKLNQYGRLASINTTAAEDSAEKLTVYVNALTEAGFRFPGSLSFLPIPPMNMRQEVAAELNAMDNKTTSK